MVSNISFWSGSFGLDIINVLKEYCMGKESKKKTGKIVKQKKITAKNQQNPRRKVGLIIYYSVAAVIVLISLGIILDNSITRTEIIESEEPIYFYTEYEDDNSLELGTEKVKQTGEDGIKKIYTEEKKKLITGEVRNTDIVNVETIKEPTKEIIRRGTRKWQYMICSDGGYRYYTDEQFQNPKVGFTHSSEDDCAKNSQGTMIGLADTPPAANAYTRDGKLSESYVRAMEIIAEHERELRNSTSDNTTSTEPFNSSTINSDPFAEERARQEAERQARAAAESSCKARAEQARESARRQLGAMGVGGSQYSTVPQSAYESTYSDCMRGYGY